LDCFFVEECSEKKLSVTDELIAVSSTREYSHL